MGGKGQAAIRRTTIGDPAYSHNFEPFRASFPLSQTSLKALKAFLPASSWPGSLLLAFQELLCLQRG